MKTTIVPAQITSVEDKIAGKLSLPQLLLLSAPLFTGSLIYLFFPPFISASGYKLFIVLVATIIFGLLAVRIKGRLIVQWVLIIGRYNGRPRYFVLNKNDRYLREAARDESVDEPRGAQAVMSGTREYQVSEMITASTVKLEAVMTNPASKLRFHTNRKGALRVSIKKI